MPSGTVWASDIEPDMVRHLEQRAARDGVANLVAVLGEPADPHLPDGLDAILVVDVVHHVGDKQGFFARLHTTHCGRARAW